MECVNCGVAAASEDGIESLECELCKVQGCESCVYRCVVCLKMCCEGCAVQCEYNEEHVCGDCIVQCDHCKQWFCPICKDLHEMDVRLEHSGGEDNQSNER